ncbi:Hypothetical protein NTJ_11994 [Nesidiocoris tenuis]|uniref:Protein TsetseEP domain-containing protein n=1 Tax=Nesidiocoris tenuis TaxID=355587 RepID=A0ABN7B433_9HEMI|nr:Hypothetical protein NTJ_11994 [Nesidiocoris tenuis]
MKYSACIVLAVLAFSAVQAKSVNTWEDKARAVVDKFEKWLDGKARAMIEKVNNIEGLVKSDVEKFVAFEEEEIKSYIASALEDVEILKSEVPVECYKNATKALYIAEEAVVEDLLACKNMSQAYVDINKMAQQSSIIALDVVKDAKVIVQGIADCETKTGLEQFKCAVQYASIEIKQIVSQWPEAKAYIASMKELTYDVRSQVNACMTTSQHIALEQRVQDALDSFSSCSKSAY